MFDLIEKYIMSPLTKFSAMRFVRALACAGESAGTMVLIGSTAMLLSVLPQMFPVLQVGWSVSLGVAEHLYMLAYGATIACVAIFFLVGTAFEYASLYAEEDGVDVKPIFVAMVSVMAMMMCLPWDRISDGAARGGGGLITICAQAVFCAVFLAWLSVRICVACAAHGIAFRLPSTVPEGVARSFSAPLPGMFVALTCMVMVGACQVGGTNLFEVVSMPFSLLTHAIDTLPGILVLYFLFHALWLVGMHGATIVTSPLTAIALSNLVMNAAGGSAVWAGEFNNVFVTVGGSGATLGLTFLMLFASRSQQMKDVAKNELVPALFNINEPLIFGLPLAYNKRFAVPFLLAPMAAAGISYCAIASGAIPPVIVQVPWPTPPLLGAFLSCGASVGAALVALLGIVVATAIYTPFFVAYDRQLREEETARELEA